MLSWFRLPAGNDGIVIVLVVFYVIILATTIFTIISDKRDPVKALSWIAVIVLLPVLGFLLYIVFGQNYRKRKIFNKKGILRNQQIEGIIAKQLYAVNSPLVCNRDEILVNRDTITLLLNNNESPITYNNKVTILNDGEETFSSIIEALRNAESSIHFEYYIIQDDVLGNQIADILIERAGKGVEVRVIYDDVGSWSLPKNYIRRLKSAGVKVEAFMPVVFPFFTSKINYRNHRKIVVVDGKIGFTGGLNIADRYLMGTKKLGAWRDTHLRLEGKGVQSLQAVFITDWYFVNGEKLNHPRYFPRHNVNDQVAVQIAASGPDSDWASIMQAYFSAITKAKSHIYISSPYFLPNESILTAIKVASLSGVDVKLMIPYHSDSKVVYWATRSYVTELLEAGVKVYMYRSGFNHSKLLMIDGVFSSVGSANMDIRSFEDNFEVSAMIYDEGKTSELEESFKNDLQNAVLVRGYWWRNRPKLHCFYEALSRLLSPLL